MADRRKEKVQEKSARGIELSVVRTEFELSKKAHDDGRLMFEGYASIFNTPDSYKDIILPGAFEKTIKQKGPRPDKKTGEVFSDIVSLWQHNPDWPFGMPVHLEEDSTGLYQRTAISDTNENKDRVQYMIDRVVKGESIGFVTLEFDWDEEDEDDWWPTRYLKELDLWEFSPVTFPAHSDAITQLVTRNRELARAVRGADHGAILQTAYGMKGITVPMVEESIAVLTRFKDALGEGEGASSGEEGDPPADPVDPPTEDPPDTREDDPELVKRLEAMAGETKLAQMAMETRLRRF